MIAIFRAPELSATSKMDRIWIMAASPRLDGREGLDGQDGVRSRLSRPSRPSCLSSHVPQHRLHTSEIASHDANFLGRLELTHRFLNPHPEQLIDEIAFLDAELVGPQIAELRGLHSIFSCAKRIANF